jgi:serine/threonine protein kinase
MKQADRTSDSLGLSATAAPPSEPPPDDELIIQAMHEYLSALESGCELDRAEFLARHPEIAGELADCLDGLDFVHAAGGHAGPERVAARAAPAAPQPSPLTTPESAELPLGDYRIIREVGQGGMGVVYEAVQLSLNRRVALKVLPFAAALDSRQLQRFKNEAHAAAQLHHTNIVPVYGVGSDRGIHYYAMQFIDGQTLAQVIAQLKQKESVVPGPFSSVQGPKTEEVPAADDGPPSAGQLQAKTLSSDSIRDRAFFRTAADLGIQAAQALEHAHQFGVIHRDIKPANLLIENAPAADLSPLATRHSPLRLWITDFGLAHCQSNAGLTMTGDLVGTLRYMSPEQALAKRVLVDHRTDIYSLGVTLYELLTLEPPFEGSDRQELLRQIAFEEPKPLRRVNPAIPSELETIVLKAMEKNPAERYATAQELADDLTRFLNDEPIRARRPTALQRLRKLTCRHPGVTTTAGTAVVVVLLLAAVGLAANNLMIRTEQERTDAANTRLQGNLELSLKALDEVYLTVLESRLPRGLEAGEEDKELLTKGLGFYERFAERNQGDPKVRREVAKAYNRAGELHSRLGQYDKAIVAQDQAAEVVARLIADTPADPELKLLLAKIHYNKGQTYVLERELVNEGSHQAKAAQIEFKKCIDLLEPLAGNTALGLKCRDMLAWLQNDLGLCLQKDGDLEKGEKHTRRAIKIRTGLVEEADDPSSKLFQMQALSNHHSNLGVILNLKNRPDEAAKENRQAVKLISEVATRAKALPGYKHGRLPGFATEPQSVPDNLAHAHYHLGNSLRAMGQPRAAAEEYRQAVDSLAQAVADWPRMVYARGFLAWFRRQYGLQLFELGKRTEALEQYRQSIEIYRTLQKETGRELANAEQFIESLTLMGDLLFAQGDRKGASVHYSEALALTEKLAKQNVRFEDDLAWFLVACADEGFRNPARALGIAQKAVDRSKGKSADCWNTLGVVHYRLGNWKDAVAALQKATELHKQKDADDWLFLAMTQWRLGEKQLARASYNRAIELLTAREYTPAETSRWRAEADALMGESLDKAKGP